MVIIWLDAFRTRPKTKRTTRRRHALQQWLWVGVTAVVEHSSNVSSNLCEDNGPCISLLTADQNRAFCERRSRRHQAPKPDFRSNPENALPSTEKQTIRSPIKRALFCAATTRRTLQNSPRQLGRTLFCGTCKSASILSRRVPDRCCVGSLLVAYRRIFW